MPGQYEDARANDTADTECHEMQRRKRALQGANLFAALGNQVDYGLPRPDVGQSQTLSNQEDGSVLMIRNKHCAPSFPCKVALLANFWQESPSAAPVLRFRKQLVGTSKSAD